MSISPVYQPIGSYLCGQACLAMILNISLDSACMIVGHRHGTTTKAVVRALDMCGIRNSGKLIRRPKREDSKRWVVKMKYPGFSGWHWVLWWDEEIYDPYPCHDDPDRWYASSFIEIYD